MPACLNQSGALRGVSPRSEQVLDTLERCDRVLPACRLIGTHDVGEAVTLADRVVVMRPRSGRLDEAAAVNLARTRDPAGAGYEGAVRPRLPRPCQLAVGTRPRSVRPAPPWSCCRSSRPEPVSRRSAATAPRGSQTCPRSSQRCCANGRRCAGCGRGLSLRIKREAGDKPTVTSAAPSAETRRKPRRRRRRWTPRRARRERRGDGDDRTGRPGGAARGRAAPA